MNARFALYYHLLLTPMQYYYISITNSFKRNPSNHQNSPCLFVLLHMFCTYLLVYSLWQDIYGAQNARDSGSTQSFLTCPTKKPTLTPSDS